MDNNVNMGFENSPYDIVTQDTTSCIYAIRILHLFAHMDACVYNPYMGHIGNIENITYLLKVLSNTINVYPGPTFTQVYRIGGTKLLI